MTQAGDSVTQFQNVLTGLVGNSDKPVVAYSGLLSLASAFDGDKALVPQRIVTALTNAVGTTRDLMMPAYTNGFVKEGVLDLDTQKGTTGMVNELFRQMPNVVRTTSAYFSFAARGVSAMQLAGLKPTNAWGEGSLFEWIEKQDALLLMIGVPWDRCSFLHRAEWNARVPYRYNKNFSGKVKLRGETFDLTETLFVRSLNPNVENIWDGLEEDLDKVGMKSERFGRSTISVLNAKNLLRVVEANLARDPFRYVQNREAMRAHFVSTAV